MPQFIALVAVGAGLYAGYKWMAKGMSRAAAEAERVREEMSRRAAEATGSPRDLGTLELDPASGEYRPTRRG